MKLPRYNELSYAHYVTTKTYKGQRVFDDRKCSEILVEDIEFYAKRLDLEILGYCIMPDPTRGGQASAFNCMVGCG